jgi:flagellar basal body-associated protein FliL
VLVEWQIQGEVIMAEETPAKDDIQKEKRKLPLKAMLILLSVMLLEGAAVSVFFVMKGGPKPAEGSDPIAETEKNVNNDYAEVMLVQDFQVDNYMAGRSRMIVTLEVAAKVESINKEKLEQSVSGHSKEILNAVRVLVSSAQPDQIKDPKLEVIKRKVKNCVEEIVGEGMIQEILMPIWQTYVAD